MSTKVGQILVLVPERGLGLNPMTVEWEEITVILHLVKKMAKVVIVEWILLWVTCFKYTFIQLYGQILNSWVLKVVKSSENII